MKRILTLLLIALMLMNAAPSLASGLAYPCYADEPCKYSVSELWLESDGKPVYGMLYLPEGDGPFPTVIMSHGMNSSESSWTFTANAFASSGFACYAYDFCGGNGLKRSGGKSSEMTVFTEKADLLAVLDQIKAADFCDTDNLFLMGESMGGLVTTLVAAERADEIKAIALYYPAFSIPDNARALYASADDIPSRVTFSGLPLGKAFYAVMLDFHVEEPIQAYAGPVCIVHGDADTLVPLASSEAAAELFAQCELSVLEGEGHGFTADGKAASSETAFRFLSRYVE